jgi:hypothetical protein
MKKCVNAALVALNYELPADPSVAYDGGDPAVGCNHLRCYECHAIVRHVAHRGATSHYPPGEETLKALYDASDPAASPLFDSSPRHAESRTYFCKCDWYTVVVGPPKHVSRLDQGWTCQGHGAEVVAEARDIRLAEAQKATDALMAATVPIFVPESGAKIQLHWALNVDPAFATASELRDSLLGSYPEGKETGLPLVRVNREDTLPAWGWVKDLVVRRSDWWPALGIALQHAATDGGEIAKVALAELLAHVKESFVLLRWTAPMAELWPDRRAIHAAGTGWGGPDRRLDALVRDQKKFVKEVGASKTAFLSGYGVGGAPIKGPLTNEAELLALLRESARAGRSPGGATGPWSWVTSRVLISDPWVRQSFERIVNTIDHDDEAMVFAMLDWFFEEQDLWRFLPLLDGWRLRPPSWWGTAAAATPRGWQRNMRSAHWPNIETLGDVAVETLRRAKWQVVTPPVVDLPLLYGASIS